ncbi:flagellar motor protein MotA [Acetobacter malorum DSM 14337]|uniref:Flagellar motor protein MotA n=1 Tax=Acetobacter malorum DSM 14337 TaxID=1307910 RepID=A0ABQ0Q112_9PROT|nr:flagellar motor stator protein MotA [Acetobacter malorum]KXV06484.1 flagellar motor protein MotA [Acetobacter malorum]GBQ86495.1 flagellar motor protein MotA [Acetobacter malorum DSM 14337]
MLFIGGLIFALLCVFGSFAASGGALGPLMASMPFELLTILGSAVGIFVMANTKESLKHLMHYVKMVIKGPTYTKDDYVSLLTLLLRIMKKASKGGIPAIEEDYENPESSRIFTLTPSVQKDKKTVSFICDYLRLSGDLQDPYQLDDVMASELKKIQNEELHMSECIQNLADALPALGIVAAVLGVIKTMASINKPPAILGEMIGGAMVGTFLGVLMAYGIFGPLAAKMKEVVEKDGRYQDVVRTVLVAYAQGLQPQICIEIGRKSISEEFMPTFQEMDVVCQNITSSEP